MPEVVLGRPDRSKGKNVALWCIQALGAVAFAFAASMKLLGRPEMVELFETIGIGQWFRYFTGITEASIAVLLVVPAFSGLGAALGIATMLGAIFTHIFVVGGSPGPAALYLAVAIVIFVARFDQTKALWSHFNGKKGRKTK